MGMERRWRNGHAPYQAVASMQYEKEYALSMERRVERKRCSAPAPTPSCSKCVQQREEYALSMEQRGRDAKYQAAAT